MGALVSGGLSGRTVAYAYDNLYRLTSEMIANAAMSGVVSYTYETRGQTGRFLCSAGGPAYVCRINKPQGGPVNLLEA